MMKKLLFGFLCLLVGMSSWAQPATQSGYLWYSLNSTTHTAEVTCPYEWDDDEWEWRSTLYSYLPSNLYIPSSIVVYGTTYTVTSIRSYAFDNQLGWHSLNYVEIPNTVTNIGSGAFYMCNRLTSVSIGNSVTSIGGYAFYGCSGLTSVTIPNSVISIGDNAFASCTNLTSVTIGNSVTSIGNYAFHYCTRLTSITIPNSVTSIGTGALGYCSNLTSVEFNARNCTTMGSSSRTVFTGCSRLSSLTIGENVRNIPSYAFQGCSGLTSVTIPNSVTSIGIQSFQNCSGLTSVSIPNSVASIGNYAFQDCSGLRNLTIGSGVTSIGANAFGNCTNLTNVVYNATNYDYQYSTNENRPFKDCANITNLTIGNNVQTINRYLFYGCSQLSNITWGSSILRIRPYAFEGCAMTTLDLPESLQYIYDGAFYECSNITSIVLPSSLKSIAQYAFTGCQSINSITYNAVNCTTVNSDAFLRASRPSVVTIGENVSTITHSLFRNHPMTQLNYNATNCTCSSPGGDGGAFSGSQFTTLVIGDNVRSIPARAFQYCYDLTSVNIPNGVTSIGTAAFSTCNHIQQVVIPGSVTTIGPGAFAGCNQAWNIYIPESVAQIGNGAFYNVPNISYSGSATDTNDNHWGAQAFNANPGDLIYADNTQTTVVRCSPTATSVVIPNTVTTIADLAFSGLTNLTQVTIPSTVTTIGTAAFRGSGLTSIDIPNSVTTIGEDAFAWCSNLTTVVLGDNVTEIPHEAFYGCTSLSSINIPSSVTSIGSEAFNMCESLASVTIPSTFTRIDDGAFYGSGLTCITIPESVTSIGEHAFHSCTRLTSITIPTTVTSIGWGAFAGSGLTSIDLPNTITSIAMYAFSGSSLSSITIPNSVTSIGTAAFRNCLSLAEVTIPNSVTSIGSWAFDRCTQLDHISIPNSVATIGEGAFQSCYRLTEANLPSSLNGIENSVFLGCSNLTSINVSNSVANIGDSAFNGCTSLTSIVIPNSVNAIEPDAFSGCDNLRTVYDVSDRNRGIAAGEGGNGNVAANADRVVKISSSAISGEGSNSIYQISATYSAVTNDDEQEYHIPEEDIPDNFIYHVNSNAKTATEWKAKNIILTDGEDAFKAPDNFIAEKVTYTRSYEQGNRSTICLPFKPTMVNGQPTTNLKFYAFADFDGTTITFNEVVFANLQANTPYMVEWPESKVAQDFVFGATTNALIPATGDSVSRTVTQGNGKFTGTMERMCMKSRNYYGYKNGYFVQSAGGQEENAHAHVNPFRAYFQITPSGSQGFAMPTEIAVQFNTAEDNVGIDNVEPQQSNIHYSNDVYDMMGRMVRKNAENLDGLRKGVYIWKGEKKVVF